MTQPQKYNLGTDFSDSEKNGKDPSGTSLDNEFTQISISVNQTIDNLSKIQRDDGKLANESVTKETLDPNLANAIDNIETVINGSVPQATESIKGGAMLATDLDIQTGTDHSKMVTPKGLKNTTNSLEQSISSNSSMITTVAENTENFRQLKNVSGTIATFPEIGDARKLYIDTATNIIYRWDTTAVEYKKLSLHDTVTNQLFDLNAKINDVEAKSKTPIGQYAFFAKNDIPSGWLRCDGSEITKETYPDLVKYLTGLDDAIVANLPLGIRPDGRGNFLRDIGQNGIAMTTQEDELKDHNHIQGIPFSDNLDTRAAEYGYIHTGYTTRSTQYGSPSQRNARAYTSTTGGEETRPVALLAVLCIKAFHGVVNTGTVDATSLAAEVQDSKAKLSNITTPIPDYSSQVSYSTGENHIAPEDGIVRAYWSVSGSQTGERYLWVDGQQVFALNKSYQNAGTVDMNWAVVGKGSVFNLNSGNTNLVFYPFKKGV